jgi:hypothetical protein
LAIVLFSLEDSMMIKRSVEEWQTLFAEQAASGLSQAAFCKKRGLCNKHFCLRRKQLGFSPKSTAGFVAVQVPPVKPIAGLQLQWRDCRLSVPSDVSPAWVADLFKSLT